MWVISTPLSITDRTGREKIEKGIEGLKPSIKRDLIDICTTVHNVIMRFSTQGTSVQALRRV